MRQQIDTTPNFFAPPVMRRSGRMTPQSLVHYFTVMNDTAALRSREGLIQLVMKPHFGGLWDGESPA